LSPRDWKWPISRKEPRMSGMRYRTGVVLALVVFILGVTAAVATGWETNGETQDKVTHEKGKGKDDNGRDDNGKGRPEDHGDKDNGDRDKDNDKGKGKDDEDNGDEDKPVVTTPSAPPAPTQVQTTPAAPLAPVSPQATPSEPGEEAEGGPKEVAQAPGEEPELASERKKLAETGLDPGLIAALGAFLVAGGAFFFRKAFAR
jgi:hypothetical protein